MKRFLNSLKVRFILTIILLSGSLIAVITVISINIQKRYIVKEETQKLGILLSLLEAEIRNNMLENHGLNVEETIRRMTDEFPEVNIALYNKDGLLRFYSGNRVESLIAENLMSRKLTFFDSKHAQEKLGKETYWIYYTGLKATQKCLACHLISAENYVGFAGIALSFTPYLRYLNRFVYHGVIFTVILFIIIIFGMWGILLRQIDTPISEMIDALRDIESGKLRRRIKIVKSSVELNQLSTSINKMAAQLEKDQEELHELYYNQLQRADKLASVGELASSIAHEIKNPLAGISGAIQILSKDTPTGDRRAEIFREILKQIERVNKTISDLLSFAKPSPLVIELGNINKIIQNTLILLEQQANRSGVKMVLNLDPGMPNSRLDEKQIQQALLNLMLNSIQAMQRGGTLTVSTKAYPLASDNYILIHIHDTGGGIPKEYADKVFDPFFTTKPNGTGLGLAIVKRIILQHKGTISVESTLEKETSFTIKLPCMDKKG